jgi:hypothetical protein
MKVIISRTYSPFVTKGSLFVLDGEKQILSIKCLELPDNGNQQNTSCIPEGVYDCIKVESTERGKHFKVLNVPGRSGILIHIGNYAAGIHTDTRGCIIPGIYFKDINEDGYADIGSSTEAMNKLNLFLPEKFKLYIL